MVGFAQGGIGVLDFSFDESKPFWAGATEKGCEMLKFRNISPIARSVAVIGATAALVTGVTFAALNNSATLGDSTINSATASLKIWNGAAYASSAPGFTVTNLIPGVPQTFPFYFQNDGGVGLDINGKVLSPTTLTGFSNNSDKTQVKVVFMNDHDSTTNPGTLADLESGTGLNVPGTLNAGDTGDGGTANHVGNYHVSFDLVGAGITGSSASVGPFTITFTGTQH